MQTIPLSAVPSQTLQVVLDGDTVGLSLYSLNSPGNIIEEQSATELIPEQVLYMDVTLNGSPIITCRRCVSLLPMMLESGYMGFPGELEFFDTVNTTLSTVTNPVYTGLGSQYQLVYFSASDMASGLGTTYP
jgi:hypothetical protein